MTRNNEWFRQNRRHFNSAHLRQWRVHPAIDELRLFFKWLGRVSPETPPLTTRATFALTRLYRLEAYSAENDVLAAAAVTTARAEGWEQVCLLTTIPEDESQWPGYAMPNRAAIADYFEDWFDAEVAPHDGTVAFNERLRMAYDRQMKTHEGCDLRALLFRVRAVT